MPLTGEALTHALSNTSWPFQEAQALLKRMQSLPEKKEVVFETGYGPSGLPHLGTFQEVARTNMVRHAFEQISDLPTKLYCVSDDMDGMRKVPENLPNQTMLEEHLHRPLTDVPDPFGTHESYGHHMNARLRAFLDHYGFDYEFKSARELYRDGTYDPMLRRAAERYDAIMKVMLPTLGEERRATYSPFLPISPKTGRVLYVPMKHVDGKNGTVTFNDEDGTETTLPVTGGHVKLQWKPDFGMRWAALGVDFEMYGKDHQANGKVYSDICKILGSVPPQQYVYEMYLDEEGEKISKSKGNGLTIDEWLRYAPAESLAYYIFQSPRKAKRLHFDVIPQHVDDYLTHVEKFAGEPEDKKLSNPAWHVHYGKVPPAEPPIRFSLLLNLTSACNTENKDTLWGFISRYQPEANAQNSPMLDKLAGYALTYYHDFVKPNKLYRAPTAQERAAMEELKDYLLTTDETGSDALQTHVFEIGKKHGFENLREWFGALYEVLLGQAQGPRMGSFIALYGTRETASLIDTALQGKLAA